MRLGDLDAVMRDAESISAFRHNLAGLSDLAIVLSGGHTIDAVPVVRCKDCTYMEDAYVCNGFLICPASNMEISDNDFCSYGERKDG